jgi:hypothetical protein
MYIDENARHKRRRPKYVLETFFGQLQHLFSVEFHCACNDLGTDGPTTIIFAAIRNCIIDSEGPKGVDIHYYTKEGQLHFVDVTSIQCLVGRVKDRDKWGIVDRSGSLARAVHMYDDETEL